MITETLPDDVAHLRDIIAWQHDVLRDIHQVLTEGSTLVRAGDPHGVCRVIELLEERPPACVTRGDEVLQLKLRVP